MSLNKCKRMTVYTMGFDKDGNMEFAVNGNVEECKDIPGKCGCIHAEIRLLEKMPNPDIVFISHSPCLDCAKALVEAKVKIVKYNNPYRIMDGVEYLRNHGVYVKEVEDEINKS